MSKSATPQKPSVTGEPRLFKALSLGLVLFSFVFRIRALAVRYLEADELEHLRGAFCVFSGWLPYKDYFEHHGPLIYYLLSPVFHFGDHLPAIFVGRGIMLLFSALIFFLVFKLAEKCFDPITASISVIWLGYVFMFLEKTIEVRPDVPALAFFLLGLLPLIDFPRKPVKIRAFSAGICFSLAFLSTQKIVFPIFGAMLVFVARAVSGRREDESRKFNIQILVWLLLGFSIPLAGTLFYFLARGGLSDFIHRNFIMHYFWKRRLPFQVFFNTLLYENPFFVFWSMGGVLLTGIRLLNRKDSSKYDIIWFPAVLGIAGLFLIPVILPQTYALVIPLLVIPAGKALSDFLVWISQPGKTKGLIGGLILFISGPGLLWLIGISGGYRPKMLWENPEISLPAFVCLGGTVCLLAVWAGNRKARTVFICLLILLMFGRPVNFMINYGRISNRGQLEEMRIILRETDISDRVLDTWPIAGFFRLPAYYYHFLHHGILEMLTPEEKGPQLLSALRANKPKIISKGINFNRLDPDVLDYINIHYRNHETNPNLLMRK